MCILILLTSGFSVFTEGNWDPATFVSSYLSVFLSSLSPCKIGHTNPLHRDIPLVLSAYLIWKFVKKTKIVPLDEIPIRDALEQAEQYPEQPAEPSKGPVRFVSWIWD